MAWITPVTNRTSAAQYGYEDLNRVGEDVQFLADLLNFYGYAVTVTTKTDWAKENDFNATNLQTYLNNITALKNAFYGTVTVPTTILTHTQANDIERLLNEVETYINRMVASFKKCGTFKSGQGVIF